MDFIIMEQSKAAVSRSIAAHAVEAAIPILPLLHLKPPLYKASVDEIDGVYRVGFVDKNATLGSVLGNPGRIPAILVRIDPITFKVIGYGAMR